MKIFGIKLSQLPVATYDWVMAMAAKPQAERYMAFVSAIEAIFFPIPPDIMLIPMGLAKPNKAWRYALICTLASVLGACVGYAIGVWGGQVVSEWLLQSHWAEAFTASQEQFLKHGIWIMLLAGFTPLPYKIFTITAGIMGFAFPLFILTSLIGRGARYFLISALVKLGGPKMAEQIRPLVAKVGWWVLIGSVLLVAAYLALK